MKRKRESVVTYEPDSTTIILDSRFRKDQEDQPTSFESILSSSIRGRKFFHQSLTWSQPLFTHNLTNNTIRLQLKDTDDFADFVLVAYVAPWIIFTEIDGNYNNSYYEDCQQGSYAFELERALNDLRVEGQNLVSVTEYKDASIVRFNVRFLKGRGLLISCFDSQDPPNPVEFKILSCNWLEKGHFIHGFGRYDIQQQIVLPPTDDFTPVVYGQSPLLCYTRYVTIKCPEISQNRAYPSISSTNQNPNLAFEIGVYQIIPEKLGVFHTQKTTNDETVIALREGVEPQSLKLSIVDENGETLVTGSPLSFFADDQTVPAYIRTSYLIGLPSASSINQLMFGLATGDLGEGQDPGNILSTLYPLLNQTILGTSTVDAYPVDIYYNTKKEFTEYSALSGFLPDLTTNGEFFLNQRHDRLIQTIHLEVDIPIETRVVDPSVGNVQIYLMIRDPEDIDFTHAFYTDTTGSMDYVAWNAFIASQGYHLKFFFQVKTLDFYRVFLTHPNRRFMISIYIQQTHTPLLNYLLRMADATLRIRTVWHNEEIILNENVLNEKYGKRNITTLPDEIIHSMKLQLE